MPPPNKTIIKLTHLISPLPLPPHHHPITYFVMLFVELELVSFLKFSSCYPINNIVVVNTKKSKNNHTKNTCMISSLHCFCTPHQHISTLSYYCPPPPLNITITIIITINTATITPFCLFTHPLTKAPNKYISHDIIYGIKKGISYQKSPKYLPTTSQMI